MGEGGGHQKITLDYMGGGVNLVQPLNNRQSIKENPDFTDENEFFELKSKKEISPKKMQ